MSKKSDDSIERIFRKAVTQYDTTFRESDWLKMEKLLEAEASRKALLRSKRLKGTAYTLTGLTVLFTAVYFLVFNNPTDSITKLNDSGPEVQATGDLRNNGNVIKENPSAGLLSPEASQDSTQTRVDSEKTKKSDGLPEKSNAGSTVDGKISLDKAGAHLQGSNRVLSAKEDEKQSSLYYDFSPEEEIKNRNQPTLEERNNLSERDEHPVTRSEGKETSRDELPLAPVNAPINNGNALAGQPNGSTTDTSKSAFVSSDSSSSRFSSQQTLQNQFHSSMQSGEIAITQSDTASVEKDNSEITGANDSVREVSSPIPETEKKNKQVSRFSVGVIFAPEFSTTRLSRYSRPGESLGLRIGYQFTNRFTVSTGVIRSAKKYKGDGNEYSPNPGYWKNRTNGIIPEKISGQCLVLEIPLDIQFDVIQAPKSRLFVSTGISSYLMLDQYYKYNFESPNPGADNDWETSDAETYWFSIGMISAGYERYLNRSLALGIEPYLKVSLAEIGWPNIKLFSTGAYVTLRYKF